MRRLCWITTFAVYTFVVAQAGAVPPPGAAISGSLPGARWIEHRVIPGERLQEIGARYRVEVAQILEWNGINADKVMLRVGEKLRIWTAAAALERKRRSYTVREGDNWAKIARRFDVGLERLRKQWNPGLAEELQPGDQVKIWVEQEAAQDAPSTPVQPQVQAAAPSASQQSLAAVLEAVVTPPSALPPRQAAPQKAMGAVQTPSATAAPKAAAAAPQKPMPPPVVRNAKPVIELPTVAIASTTPRQAALAAATRTPTPPSVVPSRGITFREVPVPPTGVSIGAPNRGRLSGGVQLPENPSVYTIRNPAHSWGTTHAVEQLQRALIAFRAETGFDREILVCDLSRQRGGRFRPHASHRTGRDVDIRLPLKAGVKSGTIPDLVSVVDWAMAWKMVKTILASGEVKYIFLSRSRQRPLYEAALKAGETPDTLREVIQYPRSARGAILRHSNGHTKHIHVRWKCHANEAACVDP